MGWKIYVLGAAILAALLFLVAGFGGWPFGPLWLDSIGTFPMYAVGGALAVLLVALFDQVRRRA